MFLKHVKSDHYTQMPRATAGGQEPLSDALAKLSGADIGSFPVIGKIEKAFDSVGLMRGAFAPLGRAGVGFAIGTGVMYALNGVHLAGFAFDESGNPRPWKYQQNSENATSVTWWMPGLALGAAFGLFI